MLEFVQGFLVRGAVMIPTIVIVAAGVWLALRKMGIMRMQDAFNAYDMRTWPLAYALGDAAIFGLIFAACSAADNELVAGAAAGIAAIIAIGVVPVLLSKTIK